jgi:transcriptional regulator GlxA family with amidase domain
MNDLSPYQMGMDARTAMTIDFMRANLQRRMSLSDLARSVNLSASHLGYLFRADTGMSPGQYLMNLRMEKARDLLAGSLLSVKQIRAEVGSNDKSNFARSFKRTYGVSPSEYRTKNFDRALAGEDRWID